MVFQAMSSILGFAHIKSIELSKVDVFLCALKEMMKTLKITQDSTIFTLTKIVVAIPIEAINFIAPLVCNIDNQTMAQILLDQERYLEKLMEQI
mgnify:CR=1 FL=1